MTLNQFDSLTEEELAMAWYVVNHVFPVPCVTSIPPRGLTWFRKGFLENKLVSAFPKIKPEYHDVFSSLLTKLGVQHEINRT